MSCIDHSLSAIQHSLISVLFRQDKATGDAAAHIQSSAVLNPEQRLGIYQHGVHAVLTAHLQAVYPVCQQLLGEAFFVQTCEQFLTQQPPTTAFLADYGGELAVFLAQQSALLSLPWVAEVARVEWARHCAWHSAQQMCMDFSQFAQLDAQQQARARFYLPESAQLLQSEFATHAVWLAHQTNDYPDKVPLEAIQIQQPTHLLVWRIRRSLHQVPLSMQQWQFLHDVQQGLTLSALVAQYAEALPALLMHSVQRGWLSRFGVEDE